MPQPIRHSFVVLESEVSNICSSAVVQPLPNEIMTETGHVGNQCVTIVTDAINCDPQVLGQSTDNTDPNDEGKKVH